jgi:molybdate transport system regulatory protein
MSTDPLLLRSNLWLVRGERSLGGPGRVELLERIEALGSIRQAALSMGMSYRVAWQAVEALNQLTDLPVVTREVGGKGGGGALVSEHGRRLIRVFRLLEAEHAQFVAQVNQKIDALMAS